MKIRVLSDLHLEFLNYAPVCPPFVGEDLVVLAGDISVGVRGIQWARQALFGAPVVYVLGNHEFYKHKWEKLVDEARAEAAGSSVYVLERDSYQRHGVTILGCSLWTDFGALGPQLNAHCRLTAEAELSDYRLIRKNGGRSRLRATDTLQRCVQHYRWLDREIDAAPGKVVVVTHHAPTLATRDPQYGNSLTNASFHNDFEDLIREPVVAWIHGHTHYSAKATVNGIPVVSNQRGYPGEGTEFAWDYCIEV